MHAHRLAEIRNSVSLEAQEAHSCIGQIKSLIHQSEQEEQHVSGMDMVRDAFNSSSVGSAISRVRSKSYCWFIACCEDCVWFFWGLVVLVTVSCIIVFALVVPMLATRQVLV